MIVQTESISDAVLVTEMLSLAIAYIYITLAQIVTIYPHKLDYPLPVQEVHNCECIAAFHTKHKNVL